MTTPIPYALRFVAVTAEQLAGWRQRPGDRLPTLYGPCPACGDLCQEELRDIVVVGGTPAAAEKLGPVPAASRRIECNCTADHSPPDGIAGGCGRYWMIRLTRAGDGTYALSPETDLGLLAPTTALNQAVTSQNTRIQGAAEKWLGAVTALYGLFSLTGLATGKDALNGVPTGAKWLVAAVLLAGLAAAATALVSGYQAAYGWPVAVDVGDNTKLLAWHREHRRYAETAAARLRRAVYCATGSLAALTVVMLLLWFLPRAT